MQIELAKIVAEGTTQMRGYDDKLVEQYAEAMKNGAVFPPVTVFANGSSYYLGDGFHRLGAARAVKAKSIEAEVHEPINGESAQRSAILFAVGANDTHGRNRTADDKRRAVEALLKDPEWSRWTDREIARQCRVSHPFVATQRTRLINGGVLAREEKRKRKDKHGNVSGIDTKNIGSKSKATAEQKKVAKQVRESVARDAKPAGSTAGWTKADQQGADAISDALSILAKAWGDATRAAQIHMRDAVQSALRALA